MLPDKVKPNLSAPTDDATLKAHFAAGNWGYYSHKIDGIRCLGHNGKAYSRKGLLIPNVYVQEAFATGDYDGFDGELVVGAANDPDVYRKTYSGVMSEHGEPDFCFHVFGVWNDLSTKFKDLTYSIRLRPRIGSVELVKQVEVHSYEQLAECEAESLQLGYEGGMYRWSEFVRQLEYKARWYGRELIGIDRWYPSSKRCFDCGYTMPKMPLSVREWVCPECGSIHDRDINAARNVLAAGLAVSAHREAVSPVCM